MQLNYKEIKRLSKIASELCKKFKIEPYVISLYSKQIHIQGNYYPKSIEKELTKNDYKLIRQYESDDHKILFKDYENNIDSIRIVIALVSEKNKA